MTYRLADVNDAERLAELLWDHVDEDTPLDSAGKAAYILLCSEHIKNRLGIDLHCWIADDSGLIAAHIYIIITPKIPKPGMLNRVSGRLSSVRTVPEYRNQGVGSALMDKVKTWSRERNLEELAVWPSERSVPFYERAGFKNENEIMEMLFE